jgi:uncharacterized protein (TIGR03083 family)
MSTGTPITKATLIAQLHDSFATLEQTLNALSNEQMSAQTDQVGWAIKDHLAHLIVWERGIVAMLQRRPRFEAMGLDLATVRSKSEDELNQIMRGHYASRSLAEVRAMLRDTHAELLSVLDALSDADLQKTYSYYQPDEPAEDSGLPIVGWIIGNSSGHYLEHLPWIKAIGAQS